MRGVGTPHTDISDTERQVVVMKRRAASHTVGKRYVVSHGFIFTRRADMNSQDGAYRPHLCRLHRSALSSHIAPMVRALMADYHGESHQAARHSLGVTRACHIFPRAFYSASLIAATAGYAFTAGFPLPHGRLNRREDSSSSHCVFLSRQSTRRSKSST